MAGRPSVRGAGIPVESLPPERNWAQRLADVARGFHPVPDRLLTTRQVAEYLGFSPETVLRRYRAGELVWIRLGSNVLRFRESAVEAFLEAGSTSIAERVET
jgi:excisionase family DNA binding protein